MRNYKRKDKKGLRSQRFKEKYNKPKIAKKEEASTEESKKKLNFEDLKKMGKVKLALLCILAFFLLVGIIGFTAVGVIIAQAPDIETDQIYEILTESTVIYDDEGKKIDTVYAEANRTNVTYEEIPEDLVNALVALEDKTFWDHQGFNFIRIVGAVIESVFSGDNISGTSTLTQQLARNLFLTDSQYDYSYKRKIIEAYYTIILEREMTKEQIIETYCNTVYFGFGCNGVQSASQAYFSKDVSELTLEECAALAALPQMPTNYQLVLLAGNDEITKEDKEYILKETSNGTYVANDISKDRRETCLSLMLKQEYITQEEYDKAIAVPLMDMLNPTYSNANAEATYFQDYVLDEVIADLMEEHDMSYDDAWTKVYQGGIHIYSTMDTQAQDVIVKEFEDDSNFPSVRIYKDGDGNILNSNGEVSLYDYDDYFNEKGVFTFKKDEIVKKDDGSLLIKYGKRLNIYVTEVNGETDYSVEFKPMYREIDGDLYSISGGFINIPQNYKSSNDNGDVIISAEFFENENYEGFFTFNDNGTVSIPTSSYSLEQNVVQPQAAMTIVENSTGHIKAMVGGRSTYGRQLHNRAVSPQQPGSSIKPLGVYSPALQQSAEEVEAGEKHSFVDYNIDQQGADLWGHYLTAGSIVVDEKTVIDGNVWPQNATPGYSGVQTMRTAIQNSINTCAVKILLQVGADYSADIVKKFGVSTLVTEGDTNDINPAALALGGMTEGVTTLDMASAYTVFPNNGTRYETTSYTKVVDRDGEVLLNNSKTEATRVLDSGVAWIMKDMLQSVVYGGTGSGAAISGVTVGGKTGTTDNEFDIWFDGFTPSYSASLWIGNDQNFELTSMSSYAAGLWGTIMNQIDGAKEGSYKSQPSNVIYTGGEYYIAGTNGGVPSKKNLEKKLKVCEDSGYLSTPSCPDVKSEKFLNYGDAKKKIPTTYCHKHNPDPEQYPISKKEKWSDKDAIAKKEEAEQKAREEEAARKQQEEEAKKQQEQEEAAQQQQQQEEEAEQTEQTEQTEPAPADTTEPEVQTDEAAPAAETPAQ